MQKNEIGDAVNEIRVLASIRHPYIVGFYDSFLAKRDRELWIIMEICACGDLASKVERYRKKRKRGRSVDAGRRRAGPVGSSAAAVAGTWTSASSGRT